MTQVLLEEEWRKLQTVTFKTALNGPPPQAEVYSDPLLNLRVDNVFYTTHNDTNDTLSILVNDDESDSDY